jgi:hypothetical protein
MTKKNKQLVAIVVVIPIFTILSHLFGYWVWGILLIAPIGFGLYFYFCAVIGEKKSDKMLENKQNEIQSKWNERKSLRKK